MDLMSQPYVQTWLDQVYAVRPERALRLDLRVPKLSSPPPLVIYISMRGMFKCEKAAASQWMVESGFALASIEARVSSEAIAPAPVHDCKAAVRWLRARADEFGFNGDAIGVWGYSAGGLLASLMATSSGVAALEGVGDDLNISSAVQAVCAQCGSPHDLAYFARPGVSSKYAPVAENLRRWLGGSVGERLDLARMVSPTTYISPRCPPIFLLHGDADEMVPLEETIEFHNKLKDAGVDATLRVLPGVGHNRVEELVKDDIAAFFKRTLAGALD